MSTLRCILATVREEVGPELSDAELARQISDAAGEVAKRHLGAVPDSMGPDIAAPIVAEAVARIRALPRA